MTLGIFSNKLIEQDCSKVVISYTSNFKKLDIMALSHHLRTICNYNITETKEQIKLFKLMIKNTLWKKINEIINNAWLLNVLLFLSLLKSIDFQHHKRYYQRELSLNLSFEIMLSVKLSNL